MRLANYMQSKNTTTKQLIRIKAIPLSLDSSKGKTESSRHLDINTTHWMNEHDVKEQDNIIENSINVIEEKKEGKYKERLK